MVTACPNCSFQGASILHDGSRKCAGCGRVYNAGFQYPEPPVLTAPTADPKRSLHLLVVVGAVMTLVVAAGFTAFVFSMQSGIDEPARQKPTIQAEVPETPQAEIGRLAAEIGPEVVSGSNGISPWWLVEYRNTGDVSISFPKVQARITDQQGRPAFDHEASAWVYQLPPGESVWILVNPAGSYRGSFTAEFEVIGPVRADRYTPVQKRLDAGEPEVVANPTPALKQYPFLAGRVRNTSGLRLSSVILMAVGYNAAGAPCAFARGYARSTNLPAGQESEYRLGTGTWQSEPAKSWRVEAWGTVRK